MATRAGDRVGVAARYDVRTPFSFIPAPWRGESAELTLLRRKSTLSPSISLRAFCTAVPASPLVESSTMASAGRRGCRALALISSSAIWQPTDSFLPLGAYAPCQRIVEADPDRVGARARIADRLAIWTVARAAALDEPAAAHCGRTELGHASSPGVGKIPLKSRHTGAPLPTILRLLDRAAQLVHTRAGEIKRGALLARRTHATSVAADFSKSCGARFRDLAGAAPSFSHPLSPARFRLPRVLDRQDRLGNSRYSEGPRIGRRPTGGVRCCTPEAIGMLVSVCSWGS